MSFIFESSLIFDINSPTVGVDQRTPSDLVTQLLYPLFLSTLHYRVVIAFILRYFSPRSECYGQEL
jgi:hypothetical protein